MTLIHPAKHEDEEEEESLGMECDRNDRLQRTETLRNEKISSEIQREFLRRLIPSISIFFFFCVFFPLRDIVRVIL